MIPIADRPWPGHRPQLRVRTALGLLALVGALVGSGCATVAASSGLPKATSPVSYRSLYVGLDRAELAQPPLLAATSISELEADFPPTSSARLRHELRGLGPQLYLGITLARFSCQDDYLADVTYGPGALLTLTVAKHQLPPGRACFELIGPLMYQVVALPLKEFPHPLTLSIVVNRPSGMAADQSSFRLP